MRDQVKSLTKPQVQDFCIRLWLELTIAGRAIWTDKELDQTTQLNALKWLNEIQHRVWGAYSSIHTDALTHLLDLIKSHCEQAPVLGFHVRVALDRSLAVANQLSGVGPNNSFKPNPQRGGA